MITVSPPALPATPIITPPVSRYLRPWDIVNQMVTWAPTPAFEADRSMECGEACIVMTLRYCSGVWTSAAYLDQLINTPGQNQGTTIAEMISLFALNQTAAEARQPADMAALRQTVTAELGILGHPLIVLRYWDHPGNTLLHYCCITGYNGSSIEMAGPGYGMQFTEDDATFWTMYAGDLILVHRKRMLGDH